MYCFDIPKQVTDIGTITDAHVGFIVTCAPSGAMILVLQYSNSSRKDLPFTATTPPVPCVTSST